MPIALDPKATFDYVLLADRDLPEDHPHRTTFRLRGLTLHEQARVDNMFVAASTGGDSFQITAGSQTLETLFCGLRGWDRFPDEEGNLVVFKLTKANPQHVEDELLDKLLPRDRQELADVIRKGSRVTVPEGNS